MAAPLCPLLVSLLTLLACASSVRGYLHLDGDRDLLSSLTPSLSDSAEGRRLARVFGPCSAQATAPIIQVRTQADFARRKAYLNTTTVKLVLMNSIALSSGLVFDSSYSCTILTGSTAAPTPPTLSFPGAASQHYPLLAVIGAGNMLFININLKNSITVRSPRCTAPYYSVGREGSSGPETCPALYIALAYNIQYTRASVYGRIEIVRTVNTLLDHLKATQAPLSTRTDCRTERNCNLGVIKVVECGVPSTQTVSGIVISNNEIYGSWELISLYKGVVGVVVKNNYLHDFLFAAVRCGNYVSAIFDCYLNTISYNYVYNPPGATSTGDSGAMYTDLHWYNPGNRFICNYIFNTDHCYYLDMASSGVSIDGGVCAGTRFQGVKINSGKYNTVRSLIGINNGRASIGYVACTFTEHQFDCYQPLPLKWEGGRRLYYDTPAFNLRWPYMKKICNPVTKHINGVACNQPGDAKSATPLSTGYCSGLPYLNDAEYILINASLPNIPSDFCGNSTAWSKVNRQAWFNFTVAAAQFLGPGDYGVRRTSFIYRSVRTFRSCPRRFVGPQAVPLTTYYWNYNRPKPLSYQPVQLLNQKTYIINYVTNATIGPPVF